MQVYHQEYLYTSCTLPCSGYDASIALDMAPITPSVTLQENLNSANSLFNWKIWAGWNHQNIKKNKTTKTVITKLAKGMNHKVIMVSWSNRYEFDASKSGEVKADVGSEF